jgi:preprotein translocase subunit SecD
MTRRRLWTSLWGIVAVAVGLLVFNLVAGNRPVLGLDLQGGVSVILRPDGEASDADLTVIRDLIRDELENRGIAEPDVRVEGNNIIVDLPGVRDQQEALDAVDVAGIVTFRPVFTCGLQAAPTPTTTVAGASTTVPATSPPGTAGPTTTPTAPATTAPEVTTGATPAATPAGFAGTGRAIAAPATPDTEPPTSPAPPATATDTTPDTASAATIPATTSPAPTSSVPLPVPDIAAAGGEEVLRTIDGDSCYVGPPGGGGEIFGRGSASVEFSGTQGWVVVADLTSDGETAWNRIASECFSGAESCPSQQLAIVLDDVIQSAPVVQAPSFSGSVSISGMDESEARSLARVIDRGAFPVRVEPATVQTVSPTLGQDSLTASVLAGLVGIALVLVMLIIFYRYLTLLVLAGMAVWGMLIYSVSAFISETTNYALTLAGVTGIIVSIGMTVDSYVIYFERLKDEVRHGRTLRNSATRAFQATWKTILAANLVSAIGAAVLFVLSVGSVRGFALYLGVTTVCDVIVLWFFTRPAVILVAQTGWLDRRNTFGLNLPARAVARPDARTEGGVA